MPIGGVRRLNIHDASGATAVSLGGESEGRAPQRALGKMRSNSITGLVLNGLIFAGLICGTLVVALLVFGEPLDAEYQNLMLLTGFVCGIGFRSLPFTQPWQVLRPGSISTLFLMRWSLFVLGLLILGFFTNYGSTYSRRAIGVWLVAAPFVVIFFHILVRHGLLRLMPSLSSGRSAVMIFANDHARRLAAEVRSEGYDLLGYFEDRQPDRVGGGIGDLPMLGTTQQAADYIREHGIEVVFITLPEGAMSRAVRLINTLGDTTASIFFVPDWAMFTLMQSKLYEIRGIPVLEVIETPFYGVDGWLKRTFDIVFAFAVLVITTPLWIGIAIAVRASSPGPIIFRQRRYGLNGEEIIVHKFRSMTVTEDDEELEQAKRDDPRITGVGKFLRRTSLDEWPQFWNVLKGDMSIVGPRPHAVAHNEFYRRAIQGYMARHKVKPGVTGWAQVNGYRGETKTLDRMERRIELDLEYIRSWSPLLDIQIVIRTLLVVFKDENAF